MSPTEALRHRLGLPVGPSVAARKKPFREPADRPGGARRAEAAARDAQGAALVRRDDSTTMRAPDEASTDQAIVAPVDFKGDRIGNVRLWKMLHVRDQQAPSNAVGDTDGLVILVPCRALLRHEPSSLRRRHQLALEVVHAHPAAAALHRDGAGHDAHDRLLHAEGRRSASHSRPLARPNTEPQGLQSPRSDAGASYCTLLLSGSGLNQGASL